ncbi:hypothetical protein Asi03nite_25030 [Actinoplanes siamensis]|uniref:Uncharacterized protein n=1 Tax=Actinoplanes siamensis TaxID=1223317 RepID=A0A919N5W5_9ACTN|nr:hypothetical protein Asi03nite_25030 [Actinoplanes siamensis]
MPAGSVQPCPVCRAGGGHAPVRGDRIDTLTAAGPGRRPLLLNVFRLLILPVNILLNREAPPW